MDGMIARRFAGDLRRLRQSGLTLDEALAKLRNKGVSIVECIVALKEESGCSLVAAKETVHATKTWQDVAQATDKMWSSLAKGNEDGEPNPTPDGIRQPADGSPKPSV